MHPYPETLGSDDMHHSNYPACEAMHAAVTKLDFKRGSAPQWKRLSIPRSLIRSLHWSLDSNLQRQIPLSPPQPNLRLYTDASLQGWGAHCGSISISGH